MKSYTLLALTILLSLSSSAQTDSELKEFGKEMFSHFVQHDFDWFYNKQDDKQHLLQFTQELESAYYRESNNKPQFPWLNIMADEVTIERAMKGGITIIKVWFYEAGAKQSWSISDVRYSEKLKECRLVNPIITCIPNTRMIVPDCPKRQ